MKKLLARCRNRAPKRNQPLADTPLAADTDPLGPLAPQWVEMLEQVSGITGVQVLTVQDEPGYGYRLLAHLPEGHTWNDLVPHAVTYAHLLGLHDGAVLISPGPRSHGRTPNILVHTSDTAADYEMRDAVLAHEWAQRIENVSGITGTRISIIKRYTDGSYRLLAGFATREHAQALSAYADACARNMGLSATENAVSITTAIEPNSALIIVDPSRTDERRKTTAAGGTDAYTTYIWEKRIKDISNVTVRVSDVEIHQGGGYSLTVHLPKSVAWGVLAKDAYAYAAAAGRPAGDVTIAPAPGDHGKHTAILSMAPWMLQHRTEGQSTHTPAD